MSEKACNRDELEHITKRLRESEAAVAKLSAKLNELARFAVRMDERLEELGESVIEIRSSNRDASAKACDRSLDRMRRQSMEFRQERRDSLLRA